MNNYERTTQEVRDAFNALCKGRVEAAVKAEREACAKIVETTRWSNWFQADCAAAIRSRTTNEH